MLRLAYGNDPLTEIPALFGGEDPFTGLGPASRVLIKPNLVVAQKRWRGADTQPETVEALIRLLQDHGVRRITVADGAGMGHSAERAFDLVGYRHLTRQYGVTLADVEAGEFEWRRPPLDGPFERLPVSRHAAEADLLINVPVMKAHGETGVTCALKNLKGLMTRRMKSSFHGADLHRAIAQLASAVNCGLTVVDAVYGDLQSETGGNPVEMGMLLTGRDPLAIDAFAARRLGFSPSDIAYVEHYARYRGFRSADEVQPEVKAVNGPAEAPRFEADTGQLERFPCTVEAEGVCCTCRSNLLFALQRLSRSGELDGSRHFAVGRRVSGRKSAGEVMIAVGDCAARRVAADFTVGGCPPESRQIVRAVRRDATGR